MKAIGLGVDNLDYIYNIKKNPRETINQEENHPDNYCPVQTKFNKLISLNLILFRRFCLT